MLAALREERWSRVHDLLPQLERETSLTCIWNETMRHPDMPIELRVMLSTRLLRHWLEHQVPGDFGSAAQLMEACIQVARDHLRVRDWSGAKSWLSKMAELGEQLRRGTILGRKQVDQLQSLEQQASLVQLEMLPWQQGGGLGLLEHMVASVGQLHLECLQIAQRWHQSGKLEWALRLLMRLKLVKRTDWWNLTVDVAMQLDDRLAGKELLQLPMEVAVEASCRLCVWMQSSLNLLLPRLDSGGVIRVVSWLREQFDQSKAVEFLRTAQQSKPWSPADQERLAMHALLLLGSDSNPELLLQQAMRWDSEARQRMQAELIRVGSKEMLRLAMRLGQPSTALRRALLRAGMREEARSLDYSELKVKDALIAKIEVWSDDEEAIEELTHFDTIPADWLNLEVRGERRLRFLRIAHAKHPNNSQIRDVLIYEMQQNGNMREGLAELIAQSNAEWVWRVAWNGGLRAAKEAQWEEAAQLFKLASEKGPGQEEETATMALKMEMMAWLRVPNWNEADRVISILEEKTLGNRKLKHDVELSRIKLEWGRGNLSKKRLNLADWMEVTGWALSLPDSAGLCISSLLRQLVGQAIDERVDLPRLAQLVRGLVAFSIEQDDREAVGAVIRMIRMCKRGWPPDELHWMAVVCHNQALRMEEAEWAEMAMELAAKITDGMGLQGQIRDTLEHLYTK